MTIKIHVAKEFSPEPAGRFVSDGRYSGESFREKHLHPALDTGNVVQVLMDGGEGYGSSFLEEAFGGLVRKGYFTIEELRERLEVESNDDSLVMEVWDYIDHAVVE